MLTALDSEADTVLGLEAGADDYVAKPVGLAELRSRIRAVLRRAGPRALGEEALSFGPLTLDRQQHEVRIDGRPIRLTFAEFQVLDALMSTPGRLFSREELLRAIWGDSAYRDPRAIDVHERPEEPKLIITVRGAGYRLGSL
jgi:DNA-binding response OmpR family regulator